MNINSSICNLKFGLFFHLLFLSCSNRDEAKEQIPNVLFIAIDDMLPVLGCYGNSTALTPNIDTLANQGVLFMNAYCQVGLSNPSRASLMTGMRPDEIKVWTLKPHFREEKPNVVTLPQFYKEKGYATRAVGKIYHDGAYHQDPVSWSNPSVLSVTRDGRGHKYVLPENYMPKRSKATTTENANVQDTAYIDGKVCQAAIELLNQLTDSTFFLAVGFRRPHLPFSAPKKYWDLYEREMFKKELKNPRRPARAPDFAFHNSNELRGYEDIGELGVIREEKQLELLHGYFASVSYIDAQIGKLIAELKRLGRYDNTIIVIYSDNGFHLGDFGLWGKTTNYEASVNIPLIFCGKGIEQGAINRSMVELIDIYPTLIDLTHGEMKSSHDGISLLPILKGKSSKVKSYALSQIVRPYQDAINSRSPDSMGYSLRTEKYRYIEWRNTKDMSVFARELYRMDDALSEKENIASDIKNEALMNQFSDIVNRIRK